jgi:hypothetical protein
MAVAGINLNINFEGLRELQANIKGFFPKKEASEVLGDAIEKAIYPAFLRLGEVTPRGPTLNLRRAVAMKVKKYPRDGGAVGLIGYRRAGTAKSESAQGGEVRAGPDRAFHQWWLEFGTEERKISKPVVPRQHTRSGFVRPDVVLRPSRRRAHTQNRNGKLVPIKAHDVRSRTIAAHPVSAHTVTPVRPMYFASSYKKLGEFDIVKIQGKEGKRFTTDPAYPTAFFKKKAVPFTLPPVQPGGRAGIPPVQTAWDQTQGTVARYLQEELSLRLSEAWAALRFRASGSITGTDTL